MHAVTVSTTTPEYTAVLDHLSQLTERFKALPGAEEALLVQFKQKRWVAITITATANELIVLALDRIKEDVQDYRVFIEILDNIEGMDSFVSSINGKTIPKIMHLCS